MDKYLVFQLNRWVKESPVMRDGNIILDVYFPPEDKLVPCFELVKEFDPHWVNPLVTVGTEANEFARQYSLDNKVRCVVVKGTVFGE
jgi:hypothetical protein